MSKSKTSKAISKNKLLRKTIKHDSISLAQQIVTPEDQETIYKLLDKAAEKGAIKVLKYIILEANINIVESFNEMGFNIWHTAARYGQLEILECLAEQTKMNFSTVNSMGEDALHIATKNGQLKIVEFLCLKTNIDLMSPDWKGNSAIHLAAIYNKFDILKYLVEKTHTDVMLWNADGFNALHLSILHCNYDIAKYLVEQANVDIRVCTKDGFSNIFITMLKDDNEMLKWCVEVESNLHLNSLPAPPSDELIVRECAGIDGDNIENIGINL